MPFTAISSSIAAMEYVCFVILTSASLGAYESSSDSRASSVASLAGVPCPLKSLITSMERSSRARCKACRSACACPSTAFADAASLRKPSSLSLCAFTSALIFSYSFSFSEALSSCFLCDVRCFPGYHLSSSTLCFSFAALASFCSSSCSLAFSACARLSTFFSFAVESCKANSAFLRSYSSIVRPNAFQWFASSGLMTERFPAGVAAGGAYPCGHGADDGAATCGVYP
mmetsp:Transcript_14607/g.39080  ORF Transcript_14607/g.39080 Transcript_14607/m.39080 type:complete len:229 (+) Transcript_14607:783-1469(+)